MKPKTLNFHTIAHLPAPPDKIAIATQTLEAGTRLLLDGQEIVLAATVLLGHRFAIQALAEGELLTAWGQPFGKAIQPIGAGDYVCNAATLRELTRRSLSMPLPEAPNFVDEVPPFVFDAERFLPAPPLVQYPDEKTFAGFLREGGRGVGTRNYIVLLGTSALAGGFVTTLEKQLKAAAYPHLDGIVALAHTEGGHPTPNNRELVLRTLAGLMVHPNVGAVLAVDLGYEAVNNAALQTYMTEKNYPLAALPHAFLTLSGAMQDDLAKAAALVQGWLPQVAATQPQATPLRGLKVALQCGGSDAFSGISGNPLAGWVAKQILCYGGSANLAESPELVNAESYVLDKVRSAETAQQFLAALDRFKMRAGWHGHTIDGNPSGGNLYRGLYNIYLKSLGAATKRNPDVRLDYVIDYAEPMREAGFYFMDSPGNDLESIAGQVAAGCNLIFFITGNGSITNFPFVPTLKIMTTSERFALLSRDMDINAGAILEGTPLAELGETAFELALATASGKRSAGEQAGHAQIQIWRDWRWNAPPPPRIQTPPPQGIPIPVRPTHPPQYLLEKTPNGEVNLILPTSLCAGQIARMTADKLNQKGLGRFAALAHTEGCGASIFAEYHTVLLGYLQHPMVRHCLLLEHGCEITHNGYIQKLMRDNDIDPSRFGWASIQLDGGIEAVQQKIIQWFAGQIGTVPSPQRTPVGLEALRLGVLTAGELPPTTIETLADLTLTVVNSGGSVVMGQHDALLRSPGYLNTLFTTATLSPTLDYAQRMQRAGFHIMQSAVDQWSETLSGIGATGVDVVVALSSVAQNLPAHPFIPTLATPSLERILRVLAGDEILPPSTNTQFQITRGGYGVSM